MPPALARWWPSVYLEVRGRRAGRRTGRRQGRRPVDQGLPAVHAALAVHGHRVGPADGLPARRRRATSSGAGSGRSVRRPADDAPGGPLTIVVYDWLIVAEKGVLKNLSPVMKPIFAANHHWAMARGEESLRLELARRHAAADPTIQAAIPTPPGPTFPHNLRRRRG